MPTFKTITTIDIRSETNNVFQNSYSHQSSTSTRVHLLPSTSITVTSSESQPPFPLIDTTPAPTNSLCNSIAPSSFNTEISSFTVSMFSTLPVETNLALETTTTTTNIIPSTSGLQNKFQELGGKNVLTEVLL
ncbi:hypothetical protein TNCV_2062451 [Trichonephila clavipes]|nr:hypothetical protein TNCV_2062451 [Trichonephila clavipes]